MGLTEFDLITEHDCRVEEFGGPVQEVLMWKAFSRLAKAIDANGWNGDSDDCQTALELSQVSAANQKVLDALMTSIQNGGTKVEMGGTPASTQEGETPAQLSRTGRRRPTTATRMTKEESSSQSAQSMPLPSHPTARAFFDALDAQSKQKGGNSNAGQERQCSAFVQKRLSTLGWRNRHSQDEYYPVSVLDTQFSVLQIQRGEIEGTYGTGACVWPAALVLVKYLERWSGSDKDCVKDKHVVDLGSGTGVTSIAAAILGARHVICTDGEAKVVQLAKDNIAHACLEIEKEKADNDSTAVIRDCKLDTQELWWGRDCIENFFGDDSDATDLVIVADCVLPKLYPIAPLVQAVDELLVKPKSLALISYEHRYYPEYDPRDKFKELATSRGLVVELVPMDEHDPVYSVDDIEIWKVYRM